MLATVILLFFYLLKERVIAGGTNGVSKMGSRVLHCFSLAQSIVLLQGTEQLQAQVVKASPGDGVGGWVGGLRPVVSLGVWFHFFSAAGAGQRQLFVNLLLGSFGRFSFVFSFCFSSDSGEGACHSHFVVLLLA